MTCFKHCLGLGYRSESTGHTLSLGKAPLAMHMVRAHTGTYQQSTPLEQMSKRSFASAS